MTELTFPHQTPATPKQAEQFQAAFQNQPQSISQNICRGFLVQWYSYCLRAGQLLKTTFPQALTAQFAQMDITSVMPLETRHYKGSPELTSRTCPHNSAVSRFSQIKVLLNHRVFGTSAK